jgi:MFS transporter, DHA3 family, tetracycline resistance protein
VSGNGARARLLLQPLRSRSFRLYWLGQATSAYGDQVLLVALALQVLRLGGGARELGLVNAAAGGSLVVFMPVAGVVVDRLPRRAVMIASDLARLAVLGYLGMASLGGGLGVGSLTIAAALYGAADAFFWPAKTAIVPELVVRDHLMPANSLSSSADRSSLVIGPGIGGLLVATAGPGAAFLFDAATFAVSAGCLLAIGRRGVLPRAPAPAPEAPRRLLGDLRDGVREVMRHRWLWVTILLFTFIVFLVVGPEEVLIPVYLEQRFRAAEAFGLLLACAGLGAIAGALLTGLVRPVRRGRWAYSGGLLSALALAGFALAGEVWQLGLLTFVWGVGIEAFQVIWDTSVQELVRPEALGRVSSLDHIGSLALLPLSFAVVGAVADRTGARPVFALAGLGAAALMCVGFLVPGVRDYRAPAPGGAEPRDARVPMLAGDREPTAR